MKRGEVWWFDLDIPRGSEPGYRRPGAIVSSDRFNRSAIRTVVIVPLTTNLRLADAPGNVSIPRGVAGLPDSSVAQVSGVMTVNRAQSLERIGALPPALVEELDRGLRLALAL